MSYELKPDGRLVRVDSAPCTDARAAPCVLHADRGARSGFAEVLPIEGAEPGGNFLCQGLRCQHASCRLFGEEPRELILQPRQRGEVPGTAHAQSTHGQGRESRHKLAIRPVRQERKGT